VSLEPCNHHGRTPPCTEAILAGGISRVVVGCIDPNPGVTGGGIAYLESRGVQVEVGVLEQDCRRLNEAFIKHATTGLPLVIAKVAASLDGKIASERGDSRWISNERSRRFVHRLRHAVDGVVVGVGTVIADDPRLTTRLPGRTGKSPVRIILDTHLRIPPGSRVVRRTDEAPTLVVTGPRPAPETAAELERQKVELLPLPLEGGRVSLRELLRSLGERDISSLMVEGGAAVHGSFFEANLVDKIHFFFAPKIIGGSRAVPMVGGSGAASVAEALPVKNVRLRRFGDDIMVEAYLARGDEEGAGFASCGRGG
jgi:diaminohydroxyphosphoribosylaminopyrimidine deaminase/5-amino-6-(5-phosphoribosylamino)uracil reductase